MDLSWFHQTTGVRHVTAFVSRPFSRRFDLLPDAVQRLPLHGPVQLTKRGEHPLSPLPHGKARAPGPAFLCAIVSAFGRLLGAQTRTLSDPPSHPVPDARSAVRDP